MKKDIAPKRQIEKARKDVQDFLKDYPAVEFAGVVRAEDGSKQMIFKPRLAVLDPDDQPELIKIPKEYTHKERVRASVMYRDYLTRSDLDLAGIDVNTTTPQKLYSLMRTYYRSKDVFGAYIDSLVNLSNSGFENDCEDAKIKQFYDNWCQDVDMTQVLDWVFQEFWTTGFVRTYKILGKYEPQVNRLKPVTSAPQPQAPKKAKGEAKELYAAYKKLWETGEILDPLKGEESKDYAARKKRWSKGFVPLAYTILNPVDIEITGAAMFNQTRIVLKPSDDMKELVEKVGKKALTPAEQTLLDNIPPEVKSAILANKDIELDPDMVGEVDYRRMPYEKYPLPKGVRAVQSLEYKDALREADYSTIDGITSEILVITIGEKDNPVTDPEDLRKVATLFNTAQKAFDVVWNHTLKVERVAAQNINQIFGVAKFEQVERDISGSFGVPRALLDGIMYGDFNKDSLILAAQTLVAEINYARSQVERWIIQRICSNCRFLWI